MRRVAPLRRWLELLGSDEPADRAGRLLHRAPPLGELDAGFAAAMSALRAPAVQGIGRKLRQGSTGSWLLTTMRALQTPRLARPDMAPTSDAVSPVMPARL
jgi:hypothetical protein